MWIFLKLVCVAIYAAALANISGVSLPGMGLNFPLIALVLLAAHGLELVVYFRYVRLYRGSLAISVVLTMLFGLLHWVPLVRASRAAGQTSR